MIKQDTHKIINRQIFVGFLEDRNKYVVTPPRTPRISRLKISDLESNIFELNMMVKSGLVFFISKFY